MARKDLVSLVAMGRVAVPCGMIMRESRLTSSLQQCLGSCMETEMRVAETRLRAARRIWEAGEGQRAWG